MKFHFIEKLKNRKYKLQKAKRKIALALASISLISVLAGCGAQNSNVSSGDDNYNSQITTDQSVDNTTDTTPSVEEQLADLQRQVDELKNANAFSSFTANDTFSQEDWDNFVTECRAALAGKINNENDEGMMAAFVILNIDYLDNNAKQVLLNHYSQGQDIESELNKLYAVLSQVRNYNTDLTNADDYLSYTSIIKDEKDKIILSVLDGYVKEVITLKQNLTDSNRQRIQEIFDIIANFSNGTGTIKVTINGTEEDIAQIHLSHGGIFAAENIAQDISVLCKDIVSQEKREDLDENLRSRNTLAKTQEIIIGYTAIASTNAPEVNAEAQELIVNNYNQQLDIISNELAVMGVTEEEAKALFTVTNISYFMDGANSQHAFEAIYADGFDMNGTFKSAEEAVRKIQAYNDTQAQVYDLSHLVINNMEDAISLKTFAQTAHGINSTDPATVASAVQIVKGYSQFSKDVTVNYSTTEADGTVINHSLDKNALSKGAYQVINWYTYYTVSNHKTTYGKDADAILPLVDGSQEGLDPYEQIVLMVDDYCAQNNIVVYNYQVGLNQK